MKLNQLLKLILSLTFVSQALATDKVLIITHSYCRPDFIELHDKTFKAFLKDDYEYVVFNDAPNASMQHAIERTCAKLNIRCIRVPQELHAHRNDAGARHIHGITYSLEQIGFDHNGIVLLIDSDMFLIKPFSINHYIKDYDISFNEQTRSNDTVRVNYLAPTLVFMNMRLLPNKRTIDFDGGIVEGLACDVGGHMYYFLKNNPSLKIKYFPATSSYHLPRDDKQLRDLGYDDTLIRFIFSAKHPYNMEFHGDNNFVHYYAGGSNWPGYSQEHLNVKNILLNNLINHAMEYYPTKK